MTSTYYLIEHVLVEDKEVMSNTELLNLKLKALDNHTDTKGNEIALLDDEVQKFIDYKTSDPQKDFARDVFLLCCGTALRISDVENLKQNIIDIKPNIKGINFAQIKTNGRVNVPIVFNFVYDVLAKYRDLTIFKNKLNSKHKRDKVTSTIKEIAKEIEISGTIKLLEHRGDDRKVTTKEVNRHEKICTHTGRRTFCTILHYRGWDHNTIAKFSGHSSDEIEQYIKSDPITDFRYKKLANEQKLQLHNYLQPQPQVKGVQTTIINSLNEGQKVLAMLGIKDVIDYDNIDDVLTQICEKEYELKQKYGKKLLRGNIKQVFNTYETTEARKRALAELINEIKKKNED